MIIIPRAVPGAGKSYITDFLAGRPPMGYRNTLPGQAIYAELGMLKAKIEMLRGDSVTVCSTDNFYYTNGEYKFDPAFLSTAHAACLETFTNTVVSVGRAKADRHVLIVDNTNTTIAEVAPYAALAGAFGHELHILTLFADPLTAWQRNVHGVPLTQVMKMHLALEQSVREWPAWWPQKIFPVG